MQKTTKKSSPKRGITGEKIVLNDLLSKGYFALIQHHPFVIRAGRRIYTEGQGCDIIGNAPNGTGLYVEVKTVNKKSLSVGPNGDIKPHQMDFMCERWKKCNSYFAWVVDGDIIYLTPVIIKDAMHRLERLSVPLDLAKKVRSIL